MPLNAAETLYNSFETTVRRLQRSRISGEVAFKRALLGARELVLLYEVTFLNVMTSFEAFQEDLFYSCIMNTSGIQSVRPLLAFQNRKQAERYIEGAERGGFLAWSRPNESITRAKRFLVGGRPFSRLERRDRDIGVVKTAVIVRNAIAHQSGLAKREFLRVRGRSTIRRPGDYLRQATAGLTQHETLSNDLLRIGKALATKNDTAAARFLFPERHYSSGDLVRSGRFRCVTCDTQVQLSGRAPRLSPCLNCAAAPCNSCGYLEKSKFEREP